MHKLLFALAGATALTAASAASAAVTIGTTSSTSGTTSVIVTDNVNYPNKLEFDTTNAAAGTVTSLFNFMVDTASIGVFSATTATFPSSSVTSLDLLLGSTVLATSAGVGSGTLLPGNTYTFRYTANLATAGNISGPANFYLAAVPEPATWGLMLIGFGGIGMAMRRRRRPVLAQIA